MQCFSLQKQTVSGLYSDLARQCFGLRNLSLWDNQTDKYRKKGQKKLKQYHFSILNVLEMEGNTAPQKPKACLNQTEVFVYFFKQGIQKDKILRKMTLGGNSSHRSRSLTSGQQLAGVALPARGTPGVSLCRKILLAGWRQAQIPFIKLYSKGCWPSGGGDSGFFCFFKAGCGLHFSATRGIRASVKALRSGCWGVDWGARLNFLKLSDINSPSKRKISLFSRWVLGKQPPPPYTTPPSVSQTPEGLGS